MMGKLQLMGWSKWLLAQLLLSKLMESSWHYQMKQETIEGRKQDSLLGEQSRNNEQKMHQNKLVYHNMHIFTSGSFCTSRWRRQKPASAHVLNFDRSTADTRLGFDNSKSDVKKVK